MAVAKMQAMQLLRVELTNDVWSAGGYDHDKNIWLLMWQEAPDGVPFWFPVEGERGVYRVRCLWPKGSDHVNEWGGPGWDERVEHIRLIEAGRQKGYAVVVHPVRGDPDKRWKIADVDVRRKWPVQRIERVDGDNEAYVIVGPAQKV